MRHPPPLRPPPLRQPLLRSAAAWLLALAALAAAPSCDGAQEIICVGRVEVGVDGKTRCFGTALPQADVVVTQPDSATSLDIDVKADVGPDPEQQCASGAQGTKDLMAACEKHCECKTGYCYDEGAYLGGFRFCTRECDGSCTSEKDGSLQDKVCLLLAGQKLAKAHPNIGDKTHLCASICKSLEDCKKLSSAYDTCGSPGAACGANSFTCWGDVTVAAQKTCQISSTVQ